MFLGSSMRRPIIISFTGGTWVLPACYSVLLTSRHTLTTRGRTRHSKQAHGKRCQSCTLTWPGSCPCYRRVQSGSLISSGLRTAPSYTLHVTSLGGSCSHLRRQCTLTRCISRRLLTCCLFRRRRVVSTRHLPRSPSVRAKAMYPQRHT